MNILDKKLEEKIKLFEKYDKMNSNNQTKFISLDLSDPRKLNKNKQNEKKDKPLAKKTNKIKILDNNFQNIYSNFDLNRSYSTYYSKNYNDLMNYELNKKAPFKSSKKNSIIKEDKKNKTKKIQKSKSGIQLEYGKNFLPKKENIIDRQHKYGINIEKKKEMIKEIKKENFEKMPNPEISQYAKNINRDPESFIKSQFSNKKDKKKININNNFSFKPLLNKKTREIASHLEPSSKRLLKKNNILDKEEIEKLTVKSYKNLFFNINIEKNKSISSNIKILIDKLYNQGLEDLKKKDLIYKQNLLNKNEEYKKYSFQPNASNNNRKTAKSLKYLNDKMYKKQVEWKKKKNLENSKKKEIKDNLFLDQNCTFKPNIWHEILIDDRNTIKRNIKSINDYIEKRRKQIKEKKEEINKSFCCNKRYGFYFKDLLYQPNNTLNTEKINKNRSLNINKNNNMKYKRNDVKKNLNFIIPPYTDRIFYYYKENKDSNYFMKFGNLNNINYSQIKFIEAINFLHKEINNLNI